MEESVTYQAIVAKGRVEGAQDEARKLVLLLGQDRFGPPDEATRTALEAVQDLERLEQLSRRVSQVSGWEELLASVPPGSRPSRRARKKS